MLCPSLHLFLKIYSFEEKFKPFPFEPFPYFE